MNIHDLMVQAHANSLQKGFWDKPQTFGESIALIHSELSEALEDFRDGKEIAKLEFDEKGKPIGIPSELADVIIRICDLACYHNVDLERAIEKKMQYNKSRERMHGKIL